MPVHADSPETQVAILAGWLGPARGSTAPASYQVEGWQDDPRSTGAQQADFDGYTPNVWASDDWVIDETQIVTTDLVSLGTPASTGTDAIRYWALRNTTSGLLAFSAPLERPVSPSPSANPVKIRPAIRVPT